MSRIETPVRRKAFRVGSSKDGSRGCTPPSEKESGVRLRMPMIWVGRETWRGDMGSRFGDSGVKGNEFLLLVASFWRSALKFGPTN